MCFSRQELNGADSELEPLDVACDYCGAIEMEPCAPDCLGREENK